MPLGLPSRPVPSSHSVDLVPRRAVLGFAAVAALVSLGSGVTLAFSYRPNETGFLRGLHAGSAAVAVMSVIAAHVIGSGGRLKPTRRAAALVVGLVVALGAAIATGTALAWTDGAPADSGVFLRAGARVVVSDRTVSGRSIVVTFVVHALLGACSLAVLGGEYVRLRWVQRRTGQ